MATNKLADILKQEYKSKGLFGGSASALGKKSLEIIDIRNTLFGGSGLGSVVGQKLFGRGYSATKKSDSPTSPLDVGQQLSSATSSLLQDISINTQISAKNSAALPKMAFDMNIMRQNIVKLVKSQGISPAKRGDMFFQSAKERENIYEEQFKRAKPTSPTQIKEVKKEGFSLIGLLGSAISTLGSVISTAISTALSTLGLLLSAAINALALALIGRRVIGVVPGKPGSAGRKGSKSRGKGAGGGRLGGLMNILGLGILGSQVFGGENDSEPDMLDLDNNSNAVNGTELSDASKQPNLGSLAMSGAQATIGALGAASVVSSVSSRSAVQGYNAKAKQFTGAGNKFVSGKNLPKGDMLKKFLDFAANASKKGWMGRIASKLALRLGTSIALKAMTFIGGLAVPGVGWFASAVSLGLLAVDAYLIYDAIFASGGILEELEKEDASRTPSQQNNSTTTVPGTGPDSPSNSPERVPDNATGTPSAPSRTQGLNNDMADLIRTKFKAAGFNDAQADAAVANAIAESNLNPNAHNRKGEDSVGLFQMNRKGGLGQGYSVEQLKDPNLNIDLAIAAAKKSAAFKSATTTDAAVAAFVKDVERPKDQAGAIAKRTAIARNLGSEIDGSSRALASASSSGQGDSVINDIKLMAEGLRAPAMGPMSLVEKAMPYDRDFYSGVIRTASL